VAAADGSAFATVVSDTASRFPRWNSTGTHLAFRCGDEFLVNQDVCVVPNVNVSFAALVNKGNGAGKIIVTDVARTGAGGPSAFAWDPLNPNRIAIVRSTVVANNTVHNLIFANFDGTGSTAGIPLIIGADSMSVQEIAWAPNGTFLILAAERNFQRRLYRINANGTGLTQITDPPLGPTELEDAHPEISPDNTQVLFLRSNVDFEGNIWNYFVTSANGPIGSEQQVSNEPISFLNSQALTGDWSPDGSQFVLVGTEVTTVGVYVMPSSTRAATYLTNRRRISGGLNRLDSSPSMR
jgi:Tol biopolymer transport system component